MKVSFSGENYPRFGSDQAPQLSAVPSILLMLAIAAQLPVCRFAEASALRANSGYSQNRDRIAKPGLSRVIHSDLRRRTVGTAEASDSHRDHPTSAIACSVTVSSSAKPVFGICLSSRMGVELPCRSPLKR